MQTPPSTFTMDFQVHIERGIFDKIASWEWRQFVLAGKSLDIVDNATVGKAKRTHSFAVHECSIDRVSTSGIHYDLKKKGKTQVCFACPSATLLSKFQAALGVAKQSTRGVWTLPPVDFAAQLVSVAASIVETDAAMPSTGVLRSDMSVAVVDAHLTEMQAMYDLEATCASPEALYEHLLDMEAAYVLSPSTTLNFAHTVAKLHPAFYQQQTSSPGLPLKTILGRCPHPKCHQPFPVAYMYAIHIQEVPAISCAHCGGGVNYLMFQLEAMLQRTPEIRAFSKAADGDGDVELRLVLPCLPQDGAMATFLHELKVAFQAEGARGNQAGAAILRQRVNEAIEACFTRPLGHLPYDLVHAMLRQLDFVHKICGNLAYWRHPQVLAASIVRYHKFMHLMAYAPMLVPTADIDLVWHAHQAASPEAYATYCQQLVGRLVDHDDTVPGGDLAIGYAHTFRHWTEQFHEPYSSQAPTHVDDDDKSPGKKSRTPNPFRVPSHDARFYGVDEAATSGAAIPAAIPVAVAKPLDTDLAAAAAAPPAAHDIFVSVIGTPVMDNRVLGLWRLLRENSHVSLGCSAGGCSAVSAYSYSHGEYSYGTIDGPPVQTGQSWAGPSQGGGLYAALGVGGLT
ncbi:Aste57867_2450 [Aphanomyces stellatus]|uniref:Aste57867_2450 protein n=1 Tax=Aphanomyces stellatus TaxID=120398 RepID=A0A485K7P3_9STRA|nr:hypothetical protein As57867_002444 [Aphanomyces stellatus]VFT79650.1 Aste57867_2450 [Aphanomyces stellatus]